MSAGAPRRRAPDRDGPLERARSQLRFGWWSLLLFLTLGIALEALNGFKIGWYLDVGSEERRQLLTLAHAHGTLLALLNVAAGAFVGSGLLSGEALPRVASRCLMAAGFLLPSAFLLGGLFLEAGAPGIGLLLLPVGASLLFLAVWLAARATPGSGE